MSRAAKPISIIALAFAPIGLLISYAIYSRDMPLDRTPLLIGAIVVGLLEIAAAIATLRRHPLGPKLFATYAILALVLVIADGAYLFAMPAREHHGMAGQLVGTAGDAVGAIFHVLWSIGAFAWPIVVLVLSRSRRSTPVLVPQVA